MKHLACICSAVIICTVSVRADFDAEWHPRAPHPTRLSWETERTDRYNRVAFEGSVAKDPAVLLKWAARDNDRDVLYAAELGVEVK